MKVKRVESELGGYHYKPMAEPGRNCGKKGFKVYLARRIALKSKH